MNYWTRVAYSIAFTIASGIVILIGLAFVSKEAAYTFLYDYYWAGIFVVAYFLTPMVAHYLKRRRNGDS